MAKIRALSGKLVVALVAVALLAGCAIGGTVAWLTAKTDAVVNTFTYGDINITLWETKDGLHTNEKLTDTSYVVNARSDLKIIPGVDLPKDPTVTVKAGSEACWLFIKVEESGTFVTDKVTYSIITDTNGWTQLTGVDNVYYREVSAVTEDTDFAILTGNKIIVKDTLTKEDIKSITTNPTLTFTAYAVQKDGIADAATAWSKVPTNP